jgi:hypothetical protein
MAPVTPSTARYSTRRVNIATRSASPSLASAHESCAPDSMAPTVSGQNCPASESIEQNKTRVPSVMPSVARVRAARPISRWISACEISQGTRRVPSS